MSTASQRPLWLFWLGAGLGLLLAVGSLALPNLARDDQAVPDGAVARVNGHPILRADYDGALRELTEREHRRPTPQDRHDVLDRLVGEELMIEHAEQLGMVRADGPTRHAILSAVFATERAPHAARIPSDVELQAFYDAIREGLERPGKLHVRQLLIRVDAHTDNATAHARAEQARTRLAAGEAFASVRAQLGSAGETDLPDQPLSVDQLRELIGPIALQAALALERGQVSAVLGSGALLRVLQLVDKQPKQIPALAEVRDNVVIRYQQRASDRGFAAAMAALRKAAEIRSVEPLP